MKPPLLAAALMALLTLAGCQRVDDAAFGQRVRAYLLEHPEVMREVAQKLEQNDRLAAQKASTAKLSQFRDRLERDSRDLVINPDGKVTVVEFFDYRCGYCKAAAPEMLRLMKDNPDVRFVMKEFPIFGEVSEHAARLAVTAPVKAKGLEVHRLWMAERALDDAALDRHLLAAGVDPAQARAAAKDPAVIRHIVDNQALAHALGIGGTPTFVIGDTVIPGMDMLALKAAIASAKAGGLKKLSLK
jgi:protein-disulfide isomerase